jgi:hypothetical protein
MITTPLNIILTVLDQPLRVVFFVFHKLQAYFIVIYVAQARHLEVPSGAYGKFYGWVGIALTLAALIFFSIKYVWENPFLEYTSGNEPGAKLSSVIWRLVMIVVLYVVVALLLYAYFSFSHMILHEMKSGHR